MKSKQFTYTRLVLAFLLAVIASILLLGGVRAPSVAQSSQERQVEDDMPKNVPIKVKLKAEKEKKFKDMSNSDWLRDFELEVTNTSDKPIYFLELWLTLPETMSENNNPVAFSLRFGRVDFIDFDTRPIDTDVPIRPGETHTFTVGEGWQQGWREFRSRSNVPDPEKVKLEFVQLSFGDGTGFEAGGVAYPYKRQQSSNSSCREGPGEIRKRAFATNRRIAFSALRENRFLSTPAAILPVNFFLPQTSDGSEVDASPDINCPGTSCFFAKAATYNCSCSSVARSYQVVGSGDPAGACHLSERRDFECPGLGVWCTQWILTPCASPTPSPIANTYLRSQHQAQ